MPTDALIGELDRLREIYSPRESSYDDQRRVYAAVASSIIWHELGDLGEDERGLSRFLEGTLRSLCQVVRALGYSGLALLFDEGDRMLSVGGRSEKVATDNLREVIDRCREDLPGAMFVYAVPPAFITDIVPKYPALLQVRVT
jgi:hypothetical protein